MSSTWYEHGVIVTRKMGPAIIQGNRLTRADRGDPTLIELWACEDHGEDPVELTPAEATKVGMALLRAAGAITGWDGE